MSDPVEVATRAVNELGAAFLSGSTTAVLAHFAETDDIVYAGSESGEVAVGKGAVTVLLDELFGRDERYCWHATSVAALESSGLLYVVAESDLAVHPIGAGQLLGPAAEQVPYRVSGVLEQHGSSWRWRLCQGCEPAPVPTTP